MKMAKASQADLDMAMELSNALDALEKRLFPAGMKRDDAELFDDAHPRHCEEALAHLLELYKRASLMRVVWGCAVMLDPRNRLVDPSADTIEHHPDRAELAVQVDGLKFDALGEPRTRYVRVSLDGNHCVMHPSEGDRYVEDARQAGDESPYVVRDVWLSEREFDDLPEHEGF